MKETYSCVTIENGEQFVMIDGLVEMLEWSADNLDFQVNHGQAIVESQ